MFLRDEKFYPSSSADVYSKFQINDYILVKLEYGIKRINKIRINNLQQMLRKSVGIFLTSRNEGQERKKNSSSFPNTVHQTCSFNYIQTVTHAKTISH